MKFIFPQNYNFNNKFLGFIDYRTCIINVVWDIFILFIINLLFNSINIKIFLFIIFCFPLLLFSIFGFNGENFIYILQYLLKFYFKQKLLFFRK